MTSNITYRAKIGLGIVLPIVLVLSVVTFFEFMNDAWIGITMSGLIWLLLLNIYATTYYQITIDNRLIIKSWIVETWEIEIKDIVSISNKNPAPLARLAINFRDGQVLILPSNKKQFIKALKKVNTNIQGDE